MISELGKTDLLTNLKYGILPILELKVNFEGLGLLYMERDYANVKMSNDEFKSYLIVDNIENTAKTEQTERYTRYLKTLIQSDYKKNDAIYKTIVGHNFEIVLLQNPYELNQDDWLSVKVLFMGKPLKNKVITARNRNGNEPSISQYSRTNEEGICTFKLEKKGDWFLHATHMIPSRNQKESDWESFWTTFSFGLK